MSGIPTFAISMQPGRLKLLKQRLGPSWAVTHWKATDGRKINRRAWVRNGNCVVRCNLKRGQLGCYDSHYRLWCHIARLGIPRTLVLEDDADIQHQHRVWTVIKQAEDNCLKWDLLYLNHNNKYPCQVLITREIGIPRGCQGLVAYVITLEGARKLMSLARPPFAKPVDVVVADLADSNQIIALSAQPRLGYVVKVKSMTNSIR